MMSECSWFDDAFIDITPATILWLVWFRDDDNDDDVSGTAFFVSDVHSCELAALYYHC